LDAYEIFHHSQKTASRNIAALSTVHFWRRLAFRLAIFDLVSLWLVLNVPQQFVQPDGWLVKLIVWLWG
jgi:hypothetical protein